MSDSATIRLCSTELDYAAWDDFVSHLAGTHYYQTYGWLKSYEPMGLVAHILMYEVDGRIQGGLAFLSAKVPFLPWRIFIVSHGPVPADPDLAGWVPLMRRFDEFCREQNGICAIVYPHELSSSSILLSRLEEMGFTAPAMLKSHRFNSTPVTIDLSGKSETDILMSCRPRTRQYIRRAMGGDLELRTEVNAAIFDEIYALLSEHGKLKGYRPRPYASLKVAWDWLAPRGEARLFQAWSKDGLVGTILVLFIGQMSYYIAGAVRREHSDFRPAEFLHWHAIREAMSRGMIAYDFTSMGDAGSVQFKAGFRPTCLSWHSPRMKLYRPVLAHLISLAECWFRPIIRGLARYRSIYKPLPLMSEAGHTVRKMQ